MLHHQVWAPSAHTTGLSRGHCKSWLFIVQSSIETILMHSGLKIKINQNKLQKIRKIIHLFDILLWSSAKTKLSHYHIIYISHYFCHLWSTLCDAVGAGAWCLEVLYYSRNFLTWWVVFDIIKLYRYILETYIIHMN